MIFGEKSVSKINIKLDEFVVTDAEVPAEGEVKITRELPAIDLSADGPSNCYIVAPIRPFIHNPIPPEAPP